MANNQRKSPCKAVSSKTFDCARARYFILHSSFLSPLPVSLVATLSLSLVSLSSPERLIIPNDSRYGQIFSWREEEECHIKQCHVLRERVEILRVEPCFPLGKSYAFGMVDLLLLVLDFYGGGDNILPLGGRGETRLWRRTRKSLDLEGERRKRSS